MRAGTIWILTHRRIGDRRQMERLASLLGRPCVVKMLVFRPPNVPFLANLLLDRARSDSLEPPWPDLALCAEARPSVVARTIGRRSRGKTKLICLGRPAGTPDGFDLVLTTAQYRLPKRPNVMELPLPLVDGASPQETAGSSGHRADEPQLVHPVTAVLVGGTTPPDILDNKAAAALAQALRAHAQKSGGTLLVVTGPRTGGAAGRVLAETIPAPHIVWEWRADAGEENPYRRFLALADEIIVTSDSVSMVADAVMARKPVSVYRLPRKLGFKHRLSEWLFARAWAGPRCPLWLRPVKWLFDVGLIEARADRTLLFDRLAREGRIAWFGEATNAPKSGPDVEDMGPIVARITALMSSDGA